MPKSVFVIDDSATMRKVFEMTFAGEDIAVVTHDGAEGALPRARELRPNAIIVDVNLPGTSSYDLVKNLRSEPNLSAVPVYLLYSDHSPLDEAAARAAGAQGAVLKPFDSQAMIDRVRQSMSGATAATAARPVTPPLPPSPPKPQTAAPVAVARPVAAPVAPDAPVAPSMKPPAAPAKPARVSSEDLLPDLNEPAPRVSARPAPPAEPMAAPTPVIPVHAADLAKSVSDQIAAKTSSLGLTPHQIEAITALTRDVVERVVWEVVPTLAETMIREELKRLTSA